MCGFPVIHLQRHLRTLVQQNHRFVALCEEFARPVQPGTKPSYDRRVVRIVTPGTLIDEPFLNHYESNYLMAISPASSSSPTEQDELGLAWLDVSTGEFFTKSTTVECLYDDIVRIHPREVVLPRAMKSADACPVHAIVRGEYIVISYFDTATPTHLQPLPHVPNASLNARHPITPILSSQESSAVTLVTGYLQSNLLEYVPNLSAPSKETDEVRMEIDAHTLKSLGIREGVHGSGGFGTLLGCLKRTVTSGGTRLLSRWLCTYPYRPFSILFKADSDLVGSPSTSLSEINTRQSIVALFHALPHLRRDLRDSLRGIGDVARVLQKFLLGRGNTDDVIAVSNAISVWSSVKCRLSLERELHTKEGDPSLEREWAAVDALLSQMEDLPELERKIQASVDSDPTRLGTLPERTEEDTITPQELSAEDKWQQGYRRSINPECVNSDAWQLSRRRLIGVT